MEQPNERYYFLHELMTRKLVGKISPAEEEHLDQLMAEDEGARNMYEQLVKKFPKQDVETKFVRYRNLTWKDGRELIKESQPNTRRRIVLRVSLAAAAVVIVAIGISFFIRLTEQKPDVQIVAAPANKVHLQLANGSIIDFSQNKDSIVTGSAILNNKNNSLSYTAQGNSTELNSLIVPNGLDYHVTLSDGTEVWLNAATTMKFPFRFTGATREITIDGEAYLKVAKDRTKPFLVHLNNGSGPTVSVLGTEFNVNSYDSVAVKVSLVEGLVKFEAAGDAVAIKPGTEARYVKKEGISIHSFDADEVLSWRQGRYYIYELQLKDISEQLVRWYNIKAVIDDDAISERRFTGIVNQKRPISALLENMKETLKIDYYFSSDSTLHFTTSK